MNLQGIVTDEEVLRYILAGLDREREGIQDRVREIEARLRPVAVRKVAGAAPGKRRLSASARERIRQGQIKRWKAFREKRGE